MSIKDPPMKFPEKNRAIGLDAAVAARRERAELKSKLRSGELTPLRVIEMAKVKKSAAATLRITDFLTTLPAIGPVKMRRILEGLAISDKKRLGGLGVIQQTRLINWVTEHTTGSGAPVLTVLAGPTAVGKGTVVKQLLADHPEIQLSVSATTREPRPGEVDGKDYFFVSDEEFDRMLAQNEMLEWATVHGKHRYGTPRKPVNEAAAAGKLVLLEIDLQGARQVRKSDPNAQLVFLAPPSWEELERRLSTRGTESATEKKRRLNTAKVELAAQDEFDHVIVNDTVEAAAEQLFKLMNGNKQV